MQELQQQKKSGIVFIDPHVSNDLNDWRRSVITQDNIRLAVGKWETRMKKQCKLIQTINIEGELELYANQDHEILKDILQIGFPFMQILNVWGNRIESAEILHRINMPSLKSIRIWENNIHSLSCFRKCHWPNLQVLNAKSNKCPEINRWPQISTNELKRIDVQDFNCDNLKIDVRFLFKMEAASLRVIYISAGNFSVLQRNLKKKFLKFNKF